MGDKANSNAPEMGTADSGNSSSSGSASGTASAN